MAVVYVSQVRIERVRGPIRHAYLPVEREPVVFSTHGPIRRHYGVPEGMEVEERASTLDYVVAAAAG
jgi:hypothetical protein